MIQFLIAFKQESLILLKSSYLNILSYQNLKYKN